MTHLADSLVNQIFKSLHITYTCKLNILHIYIKIYKYTLQIETMGGVLISTVYQGESIRLSIRDFNIKKVILLVDKEEKEQQRKSISEIKKIFEGIVEIIEKKIDIYDILSISKETIKIIESVDMKDDIFVDVTHGRKLQSLGVLFACYARQNRIKKIVYWTEEDKRAIILPKISFHINGKNKKVLENIESCKNLNELASIVGVSRPMIYRYINNLEEMGFLEKTEDRYNVTDAGKIAIL